MTRSWRRLSIVLCAAAIGCDRSSAPPVAKAKPTPPPAVAKADDAEATMSVPDEEIDSLAKTKPEATVKASPTGAPTKESSQTKEKQSEQPEELSKKPEPKAEPPKPERVAVLTPGGPLLIDVTMTLDGRPYNEAFEKQLAELIKAADTDGDCAATWLELMGNDDYVTGAMAGRPAMNERQRRDAIKQYDLNEDGRIQKQEASAWLGRDAGRSATAFRVRSSRAYVPNSRTHSRVWPFLDRDRDGELSAEELESAGDALLSLDADDDQALTIDELASLREQLLGQNQMYATSDATRDAAIHLEAGYTIERLDYILPDMYSPHQTLSPGSFSALPKLFAQLDESGEEWLDHDELARLLTVDPHVRLAIEFNSAPTAEVPTAKVTLLGQSDEVGMFGEATRDRLTLTLGGTRLVISAIGSRMPTQQAMTSDGEQNELQLMVHDQEDALFEELDANGDGRLGTREMIACQERLTARDANGDGRLTSNELPYSMVVAFTRGNAGGEGFYTPPRNASVVDSAQSPEWFRHADFNGDGDISRREFLGDLARFKEIDLDGNGFVEAGEADKVNSDSPAKAPAIVETPATAEE